jgi:putative ABC transport system permease protein
VIHVQPNVAAVAMLIAGGAAIVGAMGAVWRAVSLQPAEAMRPEPPASFKPTMLERIGLGRLVPNIARMVLRELERHPVKTAFSVLAIAMSVGIIVVGNFMQDSVDYVMQSQFHEVQRYDMMVATIEAVSSDALHELTSLQGVLYSEPMRAVAVRLRSGHRSRRVGITGLPASSELFHLLDREGARQRLPPGGLVLSRKLASVLGVADGESIRVEVLEEKRPVVDVPVVALLDDISGLNAYMDIAALQRMLRESRRVSGAYLRTDPARQLALYQQLKETPQVASVTVQANAIRSFQETIAENMLAMRAINLMFAVIIAVGVVYNSAQISLSERQRELATLRVIGFTRGEISAILLGEIGTVTLLAIPLGLAIGYGFAVMLAVFLDQEVFRFPLVIENSTYGLAASVVLVASLVSALYVRRQLDHLDLIAVLKSRD